MAENRVIGHRNRIPWHLPSDLRRFRKLTMGHPIIMGRKTFESIGRALPGRRTIVLSRDATRVIHNVEIARSLERGLRLVAADTRVFVVGGADVYRRAMIQAREIFLTVIHEVIPGDVRFPPMLMDHWELRDSEYISPDARNRYPHSFRVYRRRMGA